jgi:hypothetical protein
MPMITLKWWIVDRYLFNLWKEAMMINNISKTDMVRMIDDRKPLRQEKQSLRTPDEILTPEDKVTLKGTSDETMTYGIPQKTALMDSGFTSLREMLADVLEEQLTTTRIASEDASIDFKNLTPAEAQELVSEEGYLGVEQTSDRIVQFALSLIGNDPDLLEEIKASIDKGFEMAASALGGTLPDISMKTYDAVIDKLDAWAAAFD